MNYENRAPLSSTRAALVLASLTLPGLHSSAVAQDSHSTLARLVTESSAVVQARVMDLRADGLIRRVTFKTRQLLKGTAPASFDLTEPFQRSCGSALYGALVSTSYVIFLSGEGEDIKLTVSSARALVPLTPNTLLHVRSLVSATTAQQRLALAVDGLQSADTRIRRDSADTLARARDLASLPHAQRWRCMQALGVVLGKEDRVTINLLQVARRLQIAEAVDLLVPHYLAGGSPRLRELLLETIPRLDQSRAIGKLEQTLPGDVSGVRRGIALLSRCEGAAADRCLRELAGHDNQTIAVMARAARGGVTLAPTRGSTPRVRKFRSVLQPGKR